MILSVNDMLEELLRLKRRVKDLEESGGTVISETSYDTNAEAVSELGVGKLYRSSTLINGSPIILITV